MFHVRSARLQKRAATHEAAHATAALAFAIPIIRVSINGDPHLLRGHFDLRSSIAVECLVTLCLSGPSAETLYCGPITDDSDRIDYEMARRYLVRGGCDALRIDVELARLRHAADRLVRSDWAAARIRLISDALMAYGSLSSQQISALM